MLVTIYLAAITMANLIILWLGPQAAIATAFFLIGLDLSLRDKLHDQWQGSNLWLRMFALICGGSLITIVLNIALQFDRLSEVLQISIASAAAFLIAGLGDALVYSLLRKKQFLLRSNGSNLAGSALDSIIFPIFAFGLSLPFGVLIQIILGQFAAKTFGGLAWSLVLNKWSFQQNAG
ncbi:MAG: VUT family protein [SAR324 cluster bacterium]|nr:VUT family protein [SAR324 cluster bacterium]